MNPCSKITSITFVYHYYLSHHQLWSALKWLLSQHLWCCCLLPEFALVFLTDFCSSADRVWLSKGLFPFTISSQLLEGKGEWIISYIQQSKLELLMNACGSCNKHWRRETYWEADGSFLWKFKEGKRQEIASSVFGTMSFGVPRPTSKHTPGELKVTCHQSNIAGVLFKPVANTGVSTPGNVLAGSAHGGTLLWGRWP